MNNNKNNIQLLINSLKEFNSNAILKHDALNIVRQKIHAEIIFPFCQKHNVSFWVALIGYGFEPAHQISLPENQYIIKSPTGHKTSKQYENTDIGHELNKIIEILDLPYEGLLIGCLLGSFTPIQSPNHANKTN